MDKPHHMESSDGKSSARLQITRKTCSVYVVNNYLKVLHQGKNQLGKLIFKIVMQAIA